MFLVSLLEQSILMTSFQYCKYVNTMNVIFMRRYSIVLWLHSCKKVWYSRPSLIWTAQDQTVFDPIQISVFVWISETTMNKQLIIILSIEY